ncbi:TPA: FaeA/PapI family transcriptional regulator [Escherichia coli]
MSKNVCEAIIAFMKSREIDEDGISLRTRDIADATNLTIYQARTYLETLRVLGVVEKVNGGKGTPGLWRLVK